MDCSLPGSSIHLLRWEKVPGALGYIILRSDKEGEGYAEAARVTGAGTVSWIDRRGGSGRRYIVCAYISHGGTEYRGPMSEPVQIPCFSSIFFTTTSSHSHGPELHRLFTTEKETDSDSVIPFRIHSASTLQSPNFQKPA